MTVIDTSTSAAATAYCNQRKIDRTQNNVVWQVFHNGSTGTFEFHYSTDAAATWTHDSAGDINTGGTTYTVNGSLFIDVDDYAHFVYKDGSDGHLYYQRGTPNAGRTAWSWSAATAVETFYTVRDYPDVVAHREGTGWTVHIVYANSDQAAAHYAPITVSSAGAISIGTKTALAGSNSGAVGSQYSWPSIDFNHTGDGKTVAGSTPHLYVAWSRGGTGSGNGIRFKKATYSSGAWTFGTEREIDSGRYIQSADSWLNCLFDGTRVVMVGFLHDGTAIRDLVQYERDAADITTTTRSLIVDAASSTMLLYGSFSYDGDGDTYIFGTNQDEASGSRDLVYVKWTRATASLGSEVVVDSGVGAPYVSCKRGYSASKIEYVYTDGTASPYSVTYDSVSLNVGPNAPTGLSPDGTTIDRNITQRFSWTFSDPDSGDSQSQYDLRYRIVGAGTWTDLSIATPNTYHDFASGTFPAGDYEWQVRTYDTLGLVGPYSSSAFFTAATPPTGPTISDPVAGSTISSETYPVAWSTPVQDAYQVRTVADSAGSPDATTVYTDSGIVESATARSRTVGFPVNNRTEHIQVRIRSGGLWSTWTSINVNVSYTPPATPTVRTVSSDLDGNVKVEHTNPTPGVGEPSVTSADVYRRVYGDTGEGDRLVAGLAAGETFTDWSAASKETYEYRVRAYGDNGTSTFSTWTL